LLQRPLADLGVIGLGDGIFQERFFELIDRNDDAKYLGERVLKVTLSACVGKLDLL
jgi:hypothetical protein